MNSIHPLQALLDEYKRALAKVKDIELGIAALRRVYPEFEDVPVIDHLNEVPIERPKSNDLLQIVRYIEEKKGTPIRIKDIESFNPNIKSLAFRLKKYIDNGELIVIRVNNSNMYTYYTTHNDWLQKVNGDYQFRSNHTPEEIKSLPIKGIFVNGE